MITAEVTTIKDGRKMIKISDGKNTYFVEPFLPLEETIGMCVHVTDKLDEVLDADANIRRARFLVTDRAVTEF